MVARRSNPSRSGARTFAQLVANDLKRKEYAPVYVFVGEDDFRIETVVEHIRRDVVGDGPNATFNSHVFRGDEGACDRALQQARSFSMLGGRQFVWLRDAETCLADEETGAAIAAYAADPTEQSVLVLTAPKVDRRRRWVKACMKGGHLYEFPLPEGRELIPWITKAAQRAGLDLTAAQRQLLADLVGNDLRGLAGEIEKLALLEEEKPGPLTDEDIVANVMDQANLAVWEINAHLEPGGAADSLKTWFRLAEWGQVAEGLIPVLLFEIRRAARADALAADGSTDRDVASKAGFSTWLYDKRVRPLIAKLGRTGLRRALVAGHRSDAALKSSPLDSGLVLERFLVEVCEER